ncbi:MAG: family ATPase [Clostridia bacterium]|nr:family ATPase [Clostridia bacterium]
MVSLDHFANHFLAQQLLDAFGNEVEVVPILLEEDKMIDVRDLNLIVCSSKIIVEKIEKKVNKNIPIIPVRRSINLNKLSELVSLDTGEKVLLVSNHLYAAEETISHLRKIGVDHIDFIPYYPGSGVKALDIAVTTGGSHLVPEGVKNIIDIGIRVIDISSIVEIFIKLNLPMENLSLISAKYTKEMIRLTKYNSETNKILKAMFEVTNDGIAALDVSGNIFFCNQQFAEYLGYKHSQMISKNIVEVIMDRAIIDIILESSHRSNEFLEIKN